MKICFIGATGHSNYVLESIAVNAAVSETGSENRAVYIEGIAPGSVGEDVSGLYKRLREQYPSLRLYEDYCRMLDELKPDIAVICCFFADQSRAAIEALNRGIHVFMDKPVATTLEDLELLKEAYCKTEAGLAAMFGIRYAPWFLHAKRLVDEGAVGNIRLMHAQKSYKLGTRGEHYKKRSIYGGTIPWIGSHAIDWLHWFSNESFLSVYAAHSGMYNQGHGELEVSAMCNFVMTNEVLGSVSIDYLRPNTADSHDDDRIRIVGAEGVIEVRERKVYLTNKSTSGTQEITFINAPKQGNDANKDENTVPENIFDDFLAQVRGERKCMVSAEDSFYITEASLLARASADQKREVRFR